MANELKFGNKVIFLGNNPLTLPTAASDPGSAANGDMYYNTTSNKVRVYQNSSWQDLATGSGGVGSGVAGNLSLYPATASAVDDVYVQNGQDINISIASQPTRSVALTYNIPNPGDAVALTSFLLSNASQSISGDNTFSGSNSFTSTSTFSGTVNFSTLSASLPLKLNGSKNVISSAIDLASAEVTGVLAIANGGTNSSAALLNNRVMQSSGGAIIETAAITAARALISDANGIPTHSVTTATELSYVNGVTSSIQTQLNAKLAAALAQDHIFVGNASGLATDVAMSGEASIVASGAVTLSNAAVIAKVLTGYTAGAGTVSATDSILSAIQKIDGNDALKVAKAGDTMTGDLQFASTKGIQNSAAASTLNIGTSGNSTTINIGSAGSTVNVLGNLTYVQTTQLQVTDPTITLNKGGAAASGNGAGIEVEENALITAYIEIANSRSSWDLLAPAKSGVFRLTASSAAFTGELAQAALTAGRTWTLPDADGNIALITGSTTTAANTLLSNLGSTAVNASIIAGSDNAIDLGSAGINWRAVYGKLLSSSTVLSLSASGASVDVLATKVRQTDSSAGTNFMEEQYYDGLSLSANVSVATAIASLSFAKASFEGVVIQYKIKEATSGKVRIGKLIVSHDGTVASSSDQFSETAALGNATGLSLDAAVNGSNVDIRYNNTNASNACTMHCKVTRFRA